MSEIRRRDFLKAIAVTATGVAAGGLGCSDDGTPSGPGYTVDTSLFPQSLCSGDPGPDSVVLWTRVAATGDTTVELQVSESEDFSSLVAINGAASLSLTAESRFDHCLKVKVDGLNPATTYYYRFAVADSAATGSGFRSTRVGRTRTAPTPDANETVRFAWVSCQDFNGKYYNTYKRMLDEDLDFIVHLGDYVYETTGDPSFQQTSPDRIVVFSDTEGAIAFNEGGDDEYFAARSLSNYRELYQTHRSDAVLQQIHERFPMICIWDDHEFSDDAWGANGTYFDDFESELDVERRKNANQAWFEYMPVAYQDADFEYDRSEDFPGDIRIYRDLRFGANMHLVMTDLRTWRADHPIPEGAHPATIAASAEELAAASLVVPELVDPYIDFESYDGGSLYALREDFLTADDAAYLSGNVSAPWLNARIEERNVAVDGPPIPLIDVDGLAEGIAFQTMGKNSRFSFLGSRALVKREAYQAFAKAKFVASGGASELVMGDEQRRWFLDTMNASTATWKVWGNEFCLTPLDLDLRNVELPEAFQTIFSLSAEDWSAAGNRRDEILTELSLLDNVVAITGDIHAFFASTPSVRGQPEDRIVEFVGSAISSGTYREYLLGAATTDPDLVAAGAAALAFGVDTLLLSPAEVPNPHLRYASTAQNGFSIAEVNADAFTVEYHGIAGTEASTDHPVEALDDLFSVTRFRTQAGTADIQKEVDGAWKTWNPDTLTFE